MELSGTTFVLEIINFVVLVWILKHFLYRPVLNVIAARRAAIEKTLADAKEARSEADALRVRYEGRIEQWNSERDQKLGELGNEIDAERKRRLDALDAELARQRERAAAGAERREADARAALEKKAIELATQYAARLLKVAAAPELEARLLDYAVAELGQLPKEQAALLGDSAAQKVETIAVSSAFALAEPQRQALTDALRGATGLSAPIQFAIDATLLAGIEITIGPRVLALNLRDELAGFATLAHER